MTLEWELFITRWAKNGSRLSLWPTERVFSAQCLDFLKVEIETRMHVFVSMCVCEFATHTNHLISKAYFAFNHSAIIMTAASKPHELNVSLWVFFFSLSSSSALPSKTYFHTQQQIMCDIVWAFWGLAFSFYSISISIVPFSYLVCVQCGRFFTLSLQRISVCRPKDWVPMYYSSWIQH